MLRVVLTMCASCVVLQEHGELQLRSDLLDCHVDVCSPEVLVQISDNFDYQVRGNSKPPGVRVVSPLDRMNLFYSFHLFILCSL